MATFKEISAADIKTSRSVLNQLIDIIQEDISGSTTRKKYQVFVTGGVGPGVTSSLFQTVHDQDYTLQTANPVFDLSYGVYSGSSDVAYASTGQDSAGKLLFPSTSLMMREKINVYRQFAQLLLGDASYQFMTPFDTTQPVTSNGIDHALFFTFKRLFARDKIKRETFAMKFYQSASRAPYTTYDGSIMSGNMGPNIAVPTVSGSAIYTDIGSATAKETSVGGEVGNLVDSSNTNRNVGLLFYDMGIGILNINEVISASQHASGVIDAMSPASFRDAAAGQTIIGNGPANPVGADIREYGNPSAKFVPDFMVSASMDNILDHFASVRFQSGSLTAITFQNVTNINSTLVFCRATSDEFNYSSNPTFTDSTGRINVIDEGQELTQRTFSFVSTIGLYDGRNNLLAVAKLSRPVEKNDEKDLTFRIRLDF
jgi:hypothetical protein